MAENLYPIQYKNDNDYVALEITEPVADEIRKILNIGITDEPFTVDRDKADKKGNIALSGDLLQHTSLHIYDDTFEHLGGLRVTTPDEYQTTYTQANVSGGTDYKMYDKVIVDITLDSFVDTDNIAIIPSKTNFIGEIGTNTELTITCQVSDKNDPDATPIVKEKVIDLTKYVYAKSTDPLTGEERLEYNEELLDACEIRRVELYEQVAKETVKTEVIAKEAEGGTEPLDIAIISTAKLYDQNSGRVTPNTFTVAEDNIYLKLKEALNNIGYDIVKLD